LIKNTLLEDRTHSIVQKNLFHRIESLTPISKAIKLLKLKKTQDFNVAQLMLIKWGALFSLKSQILFYSHRLLVSTSYCYQPKKKENKIVW
jgi:hypothetical protein